MADLKIKVAFARQASFQEINLDVPAGTTIEQAIKLSGVLQHFPEIDLQTNKVGIYGKMKALDTAVEEGDRIEIYRALSKSAIEARRDRAKRSLKGSNASASISKQDPGEH